MAECLVLLAPEVSTGASTFCQQRNRRDGISTSWEVWWSDEVWDISGPAWCLSGVALASLLRIVRASFFRSHHYPPVKISGISAIFTILHHSSPVSNQISQLRRHVCWDLRQYSLGWWPQNSAGIKLGTSKWDMLCVWTRSWSESPS